MMASRPLKYAIEDIDEQIRIYRLALKTETLASASVREMWRKLVAMLVRLRKLETHPC